MNGLRSLADSRDSEPSPEVVISVAAALHRLTHDGAPEITLERLAAESGAPIISVFKVIGHFERRRLVRLSPPPSGELLAPVDWLKATPAEQLAIVASRAVEITPFLAPLLEGRLAYSPADDDALAAAVIDSIEPEEFPEPDELIEQIPLPRRRAREAIARHIRGPRDAGVRLRLTMEISFPDMIIDDRGGNIDDLLGQLLDVVASNGAIPCEDVKLRSSETIPHVGA